ncbi:WD40/YVTN/BNR-like repeat-containing protein [Oceanobacillus kimchii]|uniref:WD40/YVTN/BNR-like repeat-containing protein n=1 Tax=Oceanobacillus kimchii TaxID=746691 RepID=UPI003B024CC4
MAVPENIEELAHQIRTAIYGRDVRESIASGLEETADVADWSRRVAQDIIDGNFDEGELATEIENKLNQLEQDYAPTLTSIENEVENARGDESSLGERLNSTDSQLAETAHQLTETDYRLAETTRDKVDKDGSGQIKYANLAQDVREQFTGGNTAIVGDDSIITSNITDKAVTFEKTEFADEVAIRVNNIQLNGNFKDSDGDGVADNWIAESNTSQHRVENNAQYWFPSVNTTSGAITSVSTGWSKQPIPGHKYFISFSKSNIRILRIVSDRTDAGDTNYDINVQGTSDPGLIYVPTTDYRFEFRFLPESSEVESSVGNLVVVDLTEAFGVGNEPTAEYFEFLLNVVGIDNWFEGTINLTNVRKNGILSAKELKIHDQNNVLEENNVQDTLINLFLDNNRNSKKIDHFEEKGLHARSGKNLLNPDNYVQGRLYAEVFGEPLYVSGEGYITQKIRIDNSQSVSLNKVRIYAITDKNNIPILYQRFPNSQPVTIKAEDIDEKAYYLWITILDSEEQAQVEFGDHVTPYEPFIEIEGIYVGNKKILDYPLGTPISEDKKKELHDLALANAQVRNLIEENDFLKLNSEYSLKNETIEKETDTVTINLASMNEQKLLLHLHKRDNDGFDTVNDAYLPNAEDDFSDIQIKSDNGEVLPYRVLFYSNQLDIVADTRLGLNHNTSMVLKNSYGEWITKHLGNLKKSTDEGKSWSILSTFSEMRNPRLTLIADDDTMYFSYEKYLYRSEYPYESYTEVFDLQTQYDNTLVQTTGMVQHPDGEIFFGSYQNENHILVYKSTDNGLTWNNVLDVQDKYKHVHAIYIDEHQTPTAIYVGVDHAGGYFGGVYKTTDKGDSWVDLKEEHPDMPMSTDFGVIYADPSGYRLLGGETPTGGGYSIIKTTDDEDFKPVSDIGTGVLRVIKKGGRLFGGGSGWLSHKYGSILMSEDDGETWKSIYNTSPMDDSSGTNDGFRYMSDLDNQIVGGMQSPTRAPVRIFTEGVYAEVVVDIPVGTESLIIETGNNYPNVQPVHNDTDVSGEFIVNMPLNEGGEVIKEYVSGNYYVGNFEWANKGKSLSFLYPKVYLPSEQKSVLIKTLRGYEVDSSDFDVSSGLTISFWGNLANQEVDLNLFKTDLGDIFKLDKSNSGVRTTLNGIYKIQPIARSLPETFIKFDLVIDGDGETSVYNNGLKIDPRRYNSLDVLEAINNSSSLTLLENLNANAPCSIQNFSIRKGAIAQEKIREEFNSFVTDNYV